MSEQNPVVKRYLEQFGASLSHVSPAERMEVVREIENHIAEATGAGQSVADVLERLGPAERLAKAYSADVLIKGGATRENNGVSRWFTIASLLVTSSFASIIIVPLLGGLGIGFTLGGLGAALGGVIAFIYPGLVVSPIDLPYGLPQVAAILVGLILFGLGLVALYLLRFYFKVLVKVIRGVLAQ